MKQPISAALALSLALIHVFQAFAQEEPAPAAKAPVIFTTRQDHQNMLDQLGITRLRPGRNADTNAPNAANYDETKANPHPELPELLKTANGETVDTPELWWGRRRPEIVALLESEVYGRIPDHVPAVRWEVRQTREVEAGGKTAIQTQLVGVVDNSTCPEIQVNISMSLTLPKEATGPVPVLLSFGWTPFELESFNRGATRSPGGWSTPPIQTRQAHRRGMGLRHVEPWNGAGRLRRMATSTFRSRRGYQPNAEPTGAGLTRGIIGLANRGQPRTPDQWGALRAWGWGASRALDYLETVPGVDAKRVGIAGVSRYGKAALVAMAFDPRFALGLIASSGAGGTALLSP